MPDARGPRGAEITSGELTLHRQVSPGCWSQEGRPTSQVFKPRPSDNGLLSLTDGRCRSAPEAWKFSTEVAKLKSVGVMSPILNDFDQVAMGIQAKVFADPFTESEDGYDDAAHVVADYRGLTRAQTDKLASAIRQRLGGLSFAAPPDSGPE